MNIIVPIPIKMVDIIIAPANKTNSFARSSGSFISLNSSFNGSRVFIFTSLEICIESWLGVLFEVF